MKEKKKPEQEQKPTFGGGTASIFDAVPEPENKNVSVSSGPYIEDLPVAGMPVGEVRKKFADRFDIDKAAQAIVNGNDADESYVLKTGEALMFVRHAGEKGAYTLEVNGKEFIAKTPEGTASKMEIAKVIERAGGGRISTGPVILPTGVKAVLSRGQITIWVWERAPAIQKFSWIAANSPAPYGPGTKYRTVRIGLPYLVIFAVFNGTELCQTDECFFRNEPLKALSDKLCYPALLNCSKFGAQPVDGRPLSWICTQHLKETKQMRSNDPADRFCGGFEAVRYCLLETSFNLSSEHHEGNSWYGASKTIDPRIATIEQWEKETAKDPMFVLDVPWIPTKHSVSQVAERIFQRCNATDTTVMTSNDLARIINNG